MDALKKILSGDILKNDFLKENVNFLLLLFILSFIYIIFGTIGDYKVAEIDVVKKRISVLREQSVFITSELMEQSLESKVYQEVKDRGLGLEKLKEPPKIIEIKTEVN